MASCDMCGKTEELCQTIVEGVSLNVCTKCSIHGKVVRQASNPPLHSGKKGSSKTFAVQEKSPIQTHGAIPETLILIVTDYPQKIRQARERKGLSQKQFATMLNEKESVIAHLEGRKIRPSDALISKLERQLHIKLTEKVTEIKADEKVEGNKESEPLTLGDVISVRKRK